MKKHVLVAVALAIGSAVITTPRAVAEPERPPALATSTDSSVIDWNQIAAEATRTAGIAPALDPLHESRLYAMVHVAIHDALNSIDRRFEPYALDIRVKPGASPDAAVATAARDVLVPVLQQIQAPFDPVAIGDAVNDVEAAYTAALAAIPDGPAKDQGVVVGRAAAAVILAVRVDDGAGDVLLIDDQYPQIDEPGQYRFPEGGPLAFAPRWYTVTPFVLRHASQFLPRPPLDLTSKRYADDLNEVKRLGGNGTTTPSDRTLVQTQIAHFWWESSPSMWNRIAGTVSTQAGLDLWEQARLFALMDMGMADGYVGNWYSKFAVYNRWRPETAIRLADTDGNPRTTADPQWDPLIPTGATPTYDSGHSIEGAVASRVMAQLIGTNDITFDACSLTLTPDVGQSCGPNETTRHFTSLSQASAENGESRILVGWHFRDDVEQGAKHGGKIADLAVARFLRPVNG